MLKQLRTPARVIELPQRPFQFCFLVTDLIFMCITSAVENPDPLALQEANPIVSTDAQVRSEHLRKLPKAKSVLAVEYGQGRLNVIAEKIPLSQVLREVAQQTGVEILGLEKLQEKISVSLSDLPILEALQKLLVSYSKPCKNF
jgi:type II secretory pathway component HofQ